MKNIIILFEDQPFEPTNGAYLLLILIVVYLISLKFITKKIAMVRDIENCNDFSEIITGINPTISDALKNHLLFLFSDWQIINKKIIDDAPDDNEKWEKWHQCIKNDSFDLFEFNYLNDPPETNYGSTMKIFMRDIFTEHFSSKEDEDYTIISKQITRLFIFKGIKPEESSKFFIYIKNHFLNRKMQKGEIIQFDIYHEL